MGNKIYFDLDNNGELVQAKKLYINNNNFEVENKKTSSNFEVDKLIAETISLLNKKGYKILSSNAGHVYSYFLRDREYKEEDLKEDTNGNKYMYVCYHDGTPVKYELMSQIKSTSDSLDFIIGTFKVTFPVIEIYIQFDNKYEFNSLPNNWFLNTNDNTIMKKIFYDFDTVDYKELYDKIIESNEELLKWATELSNS